jgi:FkbM family methyltransferase
MKFHAQVGQDRYLLENFFRGKRNGVFLDVGAYDGEKFSNTLFFEESLGWKGLCVEPLPSAFQKLRARRSSICENVALSDFAGEAEFLDCDSGVDEKMLSGLANRFDPRHVTRLQQVSTEARSIMVPVITLPALLESIPSSRSTLHRSTPRARN